MFILIINKSKLFIKNVYQNKNNYKKKKNLNLFGFVIIWNHLIIVWKNNTPIYNDKYGVIFSRKYLYNDEVFK